MYADVFWVLKIYVSEAFARSRNISTYIFVGTFRGLAPPPPQYQKAGYATDALARSHLRCPPNRTENRRQIYRTASRAYVN